MQGKRNYPRLEQQTQLQNLSFGQLPPWLCCPCQQSSRSLGGAQPRIERRPPLKLKQRSSVKKNGGNSKSHGGSVLIIDQVTVQLRLRWNTTSPEGKETRPHRWSSAELDLGKSTAEASLTKLEAEDDGKPLSEMRDRKEKKGRLMMESQQRGRHREVSFSPTERET